MMQNGDVIRAAFRGRIGTFSLDVQFDAQMRGVTALFGPSGCGKTTILRCLAGLQRLSGHLTIGGEICQDDETGVFRKPHHRSIGYVFQEASLFPHLSVRNNLLYGARRAARNGVAPVIREDEIVELLGLGHLLERAPLALSGGERQRVAVGRALLTQPRLLLMDEPLSALDRMTKGEILPYFETLHAHLSIPILYVSHDFGEIQRLADSLVLIEAGRVIGAGPLHVLQADPDQPLLQSPEAAVTLEGSVTAIDKQFELTRFAIPGGALILPGITGTPGELRRLRINAADVSFTLSPPANTT
ncbi:MAG TPA: molybdenum ABC transporter ATP-binding protein, partial [Hyphomicrobiales bacterium]|nr:molybdenum ABC transporter ATP-binding protein [Hyphomicrobiales bacterium]